MATSETASETCANEAFMCTQLSSSSPYLPITIIGGQKGDPVSFYGGSDGSMLEKIGVWVGGWMIKAIKVWRTNGLSQQFGVPSGPYKEYSFQPGELITAMSLWGNGAGTRLGAIRFNTSKGNEFFPQMNSWGLKQEYPVDIGSGICIGVIGRAGSDIDSMGFIFVKPLESSTMVDVNYPTIGFEQAKVQISTLKSVEYDNSLNTPQKYELEVTEKVTKKEHWSITAGLEFSYQVSVKAGIPELAEVTTGYSFKVSVSGTYGMENTTERTEKWNFPVNVPANSKVKATVSIGKADINLQYTGHILIKTTDGSELKFDVNGIYIGVAYTDVKFTLAKV